MAETITLEDLRKILTEETGEEVTDEEIQDFLHEHYPLHERVAIHDTLSCKRCGGGMVIFE